MGNVPRAEMGGVHGGEPRIEHARVVEHLGRRAAERVSDASFSAGCSDTWAWRGTASAWAHVASRASEAGSTARTEWAAAAIL